MKGLQQNIEENKEQCEQDIVNLKYLKDKQKMLLNDYLMYESDNNAVVIVIPAEGPSLGVEPSGK